MTNRLALIDATGRLCTCNPDGTEYRIVTRRDRIYQFPAWSPNGRWIAAVGSDRNGTGIYVFEDEKYGRQWQLYRSELGARQSPFYLYWAPTSEHIGFIANHPVNGIGFHIVRNRPNSQSKLVTLGQPFFWQWLDTSDHIFVHAGIGEHGQLRLLDPWQDTSQISNHAVPGYFQAPGLSIDEAYLAYSVLDDSGDPHLVIEQRRSGKRTTQPHKGAVALSWSPTQHQLAYMSPHEKASHFYGPLKLLDINGTHTQLTGEPILAFFWSPDGTKLACFAPTRADSIDRRHSSQDIVFRNGHNPPSMRPMNRQPESINLDLWIIDLNIRSRQKILNFRPTRLFLNQFLPFFDQYAHSHAIWSPNSDAIVLPYLENGKNQVGVIPINGGPPTVLAEGFVGFWNHGTGSA